MNAAPMLELRDITRRFEKKLDFAGRIAQRLGAPVREEIVHAVAFALDLRALGALGGAAVAGPGGAAATADPVRRPRAWTACASSIATDGSSAASICLSAAPTCASAA
jgi:hypothetical protein